MAKRIIYTDYKSIDGTSWSIEIWDLYGSGQNEDLTVEMMDPGFKITWNGDENNVLQPLLSSSCSFTLAINEQQRGLLMPLIYSHKEFRLAVMIRKDSQVYWVGQVHAEECSEVIKDGYIIVDMTASDGLAQLENIDFKDENGDAYEGRYPVISWVHKILMKVPSSTLWFSQYQAGSVIAYEHHLNTPVLTGDSYAFSHTGDDGVTRGVMDYLYLSPKCYYLRPPEPSVVGDEFKRYPTTARDGVVSCMTVLKDIMAALGATICFSDGAWRIFDRTYLFSEDSSLTSSSVIQYTATQSGSTEASVFQEQIDVDVDLSNSEFKRGAIRKGLHPFASATQTHKNAGADLIYASGVNYSIPPSTPIYKFDTAHDIGFVDGDPGGQPYLDTAPSLSHLFPYTDTPGVADFAYMQDSGIFGFGRNTPIGAPSLGDLELPNGQGGGKIRLNIQAQAVYKYLGYVGVEDSIAEPQYINRPGSMAIMSFRFSVTDSNGDKYYLKRRVRTLNKYTDGTDVEIGVLGAYATINAGDHDYENVSSNWHYKPKYYESDYYTWVLSTDSYSNLAYVDVMLGGDPSVLEEGQSDSFLTYEFANTAFFTPPNTKIDSSSDTDGQLVSDSDVSRRYFKIRFDHSIELPDNSGTIESCELEEMWLEEHDANGGPAPTHSASGDVITQAFNYITNKTPTYGTERTPTGGNGWFNTEYFNHPRSLQRFYLNEIEIYAGSGDENYDNINTFTPATIYGNENYSNTTVVSGGGNLNLSGNQDPIGRYSAKSYSTGSNSPSLFFKMSTHWDSSDLADRMTHRVNKNVMEIRHRIRQVVEGALFSSTANGVIIEPWQRLLTKKLSGDVETFVPFRTTLSFKDSQQTMTLVKCKTESGTITGEASDNDRPRGETAIGGNPNPVGPVNFAGPKVTSIEDTVAGHTSKLQFITVTEDVDLNNITAGEDTSSSDLFQIFLEK